jgi:hypothetical protein
MVGKCLLFHGFLLFLVGDVDDLWYHWWHCWWSRCCWSELGDVGSDIEARHL